MLVFFAYAHYTRHAYQNLLVTSDEPILKKLPDIVITNLKNNKDFSTTTLMDKGQGGLIHFWGTWCAPCEEELPSFIRLAMLYEEKGVEFVLLAVNDTKKKIRKFLSRFEPLPQNIVVALDTKNVAMDTFGTLKVPETYLFDVTGHILKKFIGPQDWDNRYFQEKIDQSLLPKRN